MNKLTGMLLYVCVNRPTKAYVKPGQEPKPDEWKASIAIADEDVVDEFEAFAKEVDSKVSVKKVKISEFEGMYKTAPPKDAGKNVWIITLRKSTQLGKTGKEVPDLYKPKVFEKVGSKLIDVTNSKLPANGSLGSISIDKFERNNGTASLYLKNVLVTEMIEYVAATSDYEPGDEFEDAPAVKDQKSEQSESKVKAKTKAKPEVVDDEEDIPF